MNTMEYITTLLQSHIEKRVKNGQPVEEAARAVIDIANKAANVAVERTNNAEQAEAIIAEALEKEATL